MLFSVLIQFPPTMAIGLGTEMGREIYHLLFGLSFQHGNDEGGTFVEGMVIYL